MRLQKTAVSIKDICRLWTHPVVVGSGQRLVRDGSDTTALQPLNWQTFNAGVALPSRQPAQPEELQPITALALAMLGVDTELQCFEHDRA